MSEVISCNYFHKKYIFLPKSSYFILCLFSKPESDYDAIIAYISECPDRPLEMIPSRNCSKCQKWFRAVIISSKISQKVAILSHVYFQNLKVITMQSLIRYQNVQAILPLEMIPSINSHKCHEVLPHYKWLSTVSDFLKKICPPVY